MSAVFDALPGIEVGVGEINHRLNAMWAAPAAHGEPAPSSDDAKATQVNFVLHFGFRTTPDDALHQFQTVVQFSRRYPSRIVVLCPIADEQHSRCEMRAKIYGECFLGKSKADSRCVEFVLLSYPVAARRFLEDQVSICLSADLPMYYWAHRFSASGRLADYQYLLRRAKRVLIDSAVAPADALTYAWPKPAALRDLAFARILPVRQSLGQFLAAYEPRVLAEGFASATVRHGPELKAEGQALARWLRQRLVACGCREAVFVANEEAQPNTLGVQLAYGRGGNAFQWTGDVATHHAEFHATFAGQTTRLPAAVSLLTPENALSEALFF